MVSVDPLDVNKQFAEAHEADFPILSDESKQSAAAYGVLMPERGLARRWTFYIGPDGRILDIDKGVTPASAGADLVARLDALAVPKRR